MLHVGSPLHLRVFILFNRWTGAGCGVRNINFWANLSCVLIRVDDVRAEGASFAALYEIDGAAAKAPAGHASAMDTGKLASQFDHDIQFGATDFEIILKAAM